METKFGGFCGFVIILPKLVPAKDNFFCAPPNLFYFCMKMTKVAIQILNRRIVLKILKGLRCTGGLKGL